jgi:glycosyltransferase involved in cell wall biosynthesis
MRLAWFSPMPPVATGIARCSADLLAVLDEHEIDVFVDDANVSRAPALTRHPGDPDPRNPRLVNSEPRNPRLDNLDPRDPRLVNLDPRDPRLVNLDPRDPRLVNLDPRNPRLVNSDPRNPRLDSVDPRDPRLVNLDPRNPRLINLDPRNPRLVNLDPRDPRLVNLDPRDPRLVNLDPRDPRLVNLDPRDPRPVNLDSRDPRLVGCDPRDLRSAHEFVWQHHKRPYDLIVYQLGNSSHHDYQWPYLFRYPGLVVLHDAHLHHARASCLLRTTRADHYRDEFRANQPDADSTLAELAIAGFDTHLHYASPMTKLVLERSRLTAVHSAALADRLRHSSPGAVIEAIRLGHGVAVSDADSAAMSAATRGRYGIPADAIVFGCYGALTPDKRISQVLNAFAATRAHIPNAHLLLAGALVEHFDVRAEVERLQLEHATTITGYLDSDHDLTAAIASCDVALNLRWPTAREMSGPWLRCLAAGRATVIVDLSHLVDVPSLDPRTWAATSASPCTVAIDLVDEDHSLRLAMRRLGTDPDLRSALGRAGRAYWTAQHSIERMADDYRRLFEQAASISIDATSRIPLPDHLLDGGRRTLERLMREVHLDVPLS